MAPLFATTCAPFVCCGAAGSVSGLYSVTQTGVARTRTHQISCLTMLARRVLVLVCLFLAAAPLQLVSGQEGGVAEAAENVGLDEVPDSLTEDDSGVEVGFMSNAVKKACA